jgi:hypothetical protein
MPTPVAPNVRKSRRYVNGIFHINIVRETLMACIYLIFGLHTNSIPLLWRPHSTIFAECTDVGLMHQSI